MAGCIKAMLWGQESNPNPSVEHVHVAWESKLRSVISTSIHPCQGNWVAIGHAAVYYARAVWAFSAETKYRHCRELQHYRGFCKCVNWGCRHHYKRKLTPYGEVTIVKSLLLSKITHILLSLPSPKAQTIKRI